MRSGVLAVCVGFVASAAVAAPVPKVTPPNPKSPSSATLVVLKGESGQVTVSIPRTVMETRNETRTETVNGRQVQETVTVSVPVTVMTTITLDLSKHKVTAANGKELAADDLTAKLKEGVPAVLVSFGQTLDPEWRKLFADGVLFVEPPQPEKK